MQPNKDIIGKNRKGNKIVVQNEDGPAATGKRASVPLQRNTGNPAAVPL